MEKKKKNGLTILARIFIISNGIILLDAIVTIFDPFFNGGLVWNLLKMIVSISSMTHPITFEFLYTLPIPLSSYYLIVSKVSAIGILCGIGILKFSKFLRIFTIIFNLIFVVLLLTRLMSVGAMFDIFNIFTIFYPLSILLSILVHIWYIVYLFSPKVKEQFK